MEEVGLMQARDTLGQIVNRARYAGEPTRITRQGKPAAVVVNSEWYAWATGVIEGAQLRDKEKGNR